MDFGSDYAFGTGAHRSCRFASAVRPSAQTTSNVAVASAATATASNTTGNTTTHRYRR